MSRYFYNHISTSMTLALCMISGLSLLPRLAAQEMAPAATPAPAPADRVDLKLTKTKEDYANLGLEGSELVPAKVFHGGHEANKDFTRDLYQVQWRAQDPIDLFIIRPIGVKNPPVVLYLFSYPSDSKRFLSAEYCKRLVSNGAAAVGFVSANTGDRFHRPMKEWFVSELQESLGTTVHDVQMILNFLDGIDDLDKTHLGMFAQGSGGAIAILAAATDPRIKALDLVGPWGDWPDFLSEAPGIPSEEKPKYLTPEFLKKVEPLEPTRYLPTLKTQSIRIQLLNENPPVKWSASIEKAAPPNAEIRHYNSPEELQPESISGKLYAWIAGKLNPAADTKTMAPTQPAASADKKGPVQ